MPTVSQLMQLSKSLELRRVNDLHYREGEDHLVVDAVLYNLGAGVRVVAVEHLHREGL